MVLIPIAVLMKNHCLYYTTELLQQQQSQRQIIPDLAAPQVC
jgi:hypothetical protein